MNTFSRKPTATAAVPTALASVHFIKKDESGRILVKVRILTAEEVQYRDYWVPALTDQVVARALRSAGIPCAWMHATLPILEAPQESQPACTYSTPATYGPEEPE